MPTFCFQSTEPALHAATGDGLGARYQRNAVPRPLCVPVPRCVICRSGCGCSWQSARPTVRSCYRPAPLAETPAPSRSANRRPNPAVDQMPALRLAGTYHHRSRAVHCALRRVSNLAPHSRLPAAGSNPLGIVVLSNSAPIGLPKPSPPSRPAYARTASPRLIPPNQPALKTILAQDIPQSSLLISLPPAPARPTRR